MSRNQMPLPEQHEHHIMYSKRTYLGDGLHAWWIFTGSRQLEQVVCSTLGCSIAIGLWSLVL